ncbi:alginate export family protein [Sphingobium sp. AR-3-1]|uniref:Alginate export family protein n=1 Tax=Sphingobium psychrophilum TaxID=2728834 RepID=A0A7X9WYN1_9SPHN|nr:alginate export family protein [Sphingobium psychrophilum]NML12306.1 alginate export family protein [Sphingobium psychrophilum]
MLRILLAAGLLAGAVPAPASAQQREAWQAPTLSITRYDEDWSDLADAEKRAHHWTGPLKHIPLGDDSWVTTGIELRARSENYQNNLWGGADAPDDSYLWLRALPYADLHVGKVRAFVQPILAYAIGVSPSASPIDQTRADLLQGFGEVDLGPVTLRAGRQMLSLGTERLVGTRYGPNVPLAFDGARADVTIGRAKISLLNMRPVQPGPGSFDDATSDAKALWGAYTTLPELDIYYLGYRNRLAHFGGQAGREVRHSIGLRSHGARGDWHWNVEGAAQFGHFEGQRISAWTLGTEVGHSFPTLPFAPDATLRVNVVSGDSKAGDGKLGTFNALFPKGKYFGELSPVGPTNIVSVNPRVSGTFGGGVSFSLAAMAYWRYSIADGVYDIPGNLIREANGSKARFIGKEAEATIACQATPEWELSASLSAFAPGAFIKETGPAKTITMLGLESNFRF